ncbi:Ubiquitin carboxyl-terminal hydrolase 12 [Morus notabilis]|uniref:Ubiquitin carboxyl-terminal hydrolase 12 n=2 Tax=Morus notabilis TaxID=981085 RepID=W9QKW9_9ROSA|nr:Ubiquitin carboxyl-terminal hydrolase 12 [Morus notabilis]
MSREVSELVPLHPNMVLSEDPFSNQSYDPNYQSEFQTAPSSPPNKGSTTELSFPLLPKLLQQPKLNVSNVFSARDAVPSHHLLKIESFSSLSKAPIEKYVSEFEAGGYKWNLSIYPNGDKNKDGQDHISMYLEMVETSSLPAGWEVNAIFNFFVFDQLRDKYVGPQDATVRRFHCVKTQWGIETFIDLKTFNNPSNGYLVSDTCSFGVEVFVVKSTSKAERLLPIKNPVTFKHAWMFDSFSRKTQEYYESDFFVGGDYIWKIVFFPNGCQLEGHKRNYNIISLALRLEPLTLPPGTKLLVHFKFRIKDQKNGNHFDRNDSKLFGFNYLRRDIIDFMSLTKFKDPQNGFLVNDTCIIEAEFEVLGFVTVE